MSDGDNATPGRPRPSDPGGDNHWLTRIPRPSLGAAPWERGPSSESEDSAGAKPTGDHADGITVAELIAKVTDAESSTVPARHRAEPEPGAADDQDTEIIPVVSAYASELPDLSPDSGRVPPSRIATVVALRRPNRTVAAAG